VLRIIHPFLSEGDGGNRSVVASSLVGVTPIADGVRGAGAGLLLLVVAAMNREAWRGAIAAFLFLIKPSLLF
jgi:hypothetical protein